MNEEILLRYLKCETTPREEKAIAKWLQEDYANRREIDRIRLIFDELTFVAPVQTEVVPLRRKTTLRRRLITASAVAAVTLLAVGFGLNSLRMLNKLERLSEQTVSVEVPAGQRMSITLADGTLVWLNAGTTLEYPAVFLGERRKVKLSGEALFEVEYDAEHPFTVETFACDIEVLGTKFNVQSFEDTQTFSTALMNGSVKLTDRAHGVSITMKPNEEVDLVDGNLQIKKLSNPDEYLWPEGIISITDMSFGEVMARFERMFGVEIEIANNQIVNTGYGRGKIRVSEGVDRALTGMQLITNFTYTIDQDTGVITIQ